MNIREEMMQSLYELMVNENLNKELDKASKEEIELCEANFPKEKQDDYMNALFNLERAAFMAGTNMVLDMISGKEA